MPSKEETLKLIHEIFADACRCHNMASRQALRGMAFGMATLAIQLGLLNELDYDNLVAQYIS